MGPRIALLLTGEAADLSTTICAVQIAARSGSTLYALQDTFYTGQQDMTPTAALNAGAAANNFADSFSFVVDFASSEGVQVNCHLLDTKTIGQMIEFLTAHSISCLVVNKSCKNQGMRATRLADLKQRLLDEPRCFYSQLQVITAPLLEEKDLQQFFRQYRRLDRFGGKRSNRR